MSHNCGGHPECGFCIRQMQGRKTPFIQYVTAEEMDKIITEMEELGYDMTGVHSVSIKSSETGEDRCGQKGTLP